MRTPDCGSHSAGKRLVVDIVFPVCLRFSVSSQSFKHEKSRRMAGFQARGQLDSALAGFETGVRFANHKDLAATTNDLAVTMAGLCRLERIQDFHGQFLSFTETGSKNYTAKILCRQSLVERNLNPCRH
jgi:hypothetical protein